MNVAIDAYGLRYDGGVRTYTASLVDALAATETDLTILYPSKSDRLDLETDFDVIGPAAKFLVPYRDNVAIARYLRASEIDLLHVTRSTGPIFRPSQDVKLVRTVHDFCSRYTETTRTDLASRVYKQVVQRRVFANTDAIICPSRSTRRQVRDLYDPAADIHVTPLGYDPVFEELPDERTRRTREKYELDKPFVLFVGVLTPRKNVLALVEAFSRLQIAHRYSLVLAGELGPGGDRILRTIDRSYGHEDVRYLGHVPLADLVDLYNLATVFVFPSFCEGFGLPPLEAMACGSPVITSNTSSLPEVVGTAGMTVNPARTEELAERIRTILDDVSLQTEMSQRSLMRAAQFSWAATARQTIGVYREVLGDQGAT